MKKCDELVPDLLELVFDEPAPETAMRLNEHLAGCSTCRGEEMRLLGVRGALRREYRAPGKPLRERIRAQLPVQREQRWFGFVRRPVPAYAAAVACVAVAAATIVALRGAPAGAPAGGPAATRTATLAPDSIAGELAPFTPAGPYDIGITWVVRQPTPGDSAVRQHHGDRL
jgi:anti-sigma factor RsiW